MGYIESPPVALNQLLEVVPDGIAFVDEYGVICHANKRLEGLTGYARDELVGQTVEVLLQSRCRDTHVALGHEFARDPIPRVPVMARHLDYRLLRRDGSELMVDVARAQFVLDGKPWAVVAVCDDSGQRTAGHVRTKAELRAIATELAAAEALASSEQRFRLAFENNVAGMILVDLEDKVLAVNDSFCQMVGRNREEVIDNGAAPFTHPKEFHGHLSPDETARVSYIDRFRHKDGRVIVVEVSKSIALDAAGVPLYSVISVRDVTQERALTAQLSHQALHDSLTGLPNRALFEDRLSQANGRAARGAGWNAVLMLDLDNFKGVNDTLGHVVGDQLLVAFARRLEQMSRSSDTLCRLGGDEFLYLAEGLTYPAQAEDVAERLLAAVAGPFYIDGVRLEQHASIGVVVWEGASKDCSELLQDVDVAMYQAKRRGEGRHVVFTPAMYEDEDNRFALTQELGHALAAGELSMYYQPFVNLATSQVIGFEALMRWQHPERGHIPPNVFIPLAEKTDLIYALGSFALHDAVSKARSWEPTAARASRLFVTVNLSARQFHDPNLVSMIEEALTASGLAPERLVLEITESVALDDIAGTMSAIARLDRIGVAFALDDFGTGYSSLSYLALLHPMIIKIDRSFVSPLHGSVYNDTLLEAIVSLGQKLKMTVLAEGIETQEQLEHLRRLRCEIGQGYFFSPAAPSGELAAMLGRVPRSWAQRLKRSTPTPVGPRDQAPPDHQGLST